MGTTSIFRNIFHGLEESALDTLRRVAQVRSYPPETILCHQGEVEHTFYVIVDGRVAVTQSLADGQERLLAIRGPNEYFGELALLDNTPRMASCTTLVPTTVLEVTEEVFDDLVERSPAIAYALTRHIVELLRDTDRQAIEDLKAKNEKLQQAYRELQEAQARLVEKQRLVRELEIAAEVQRTLLPNRLPAYPGYHFACYLQPAHQVGGDYYDVFELDSEHLGLLIADVADKSIQAALFMAVTYTLFHVESKHSLSPAAVAMAVHESMFEVAPASDMFVTAFYGVLHRPTGRLKYVLAGHERPLWIRTGELVKPLSGSGRFLGMLEPLRLDEYIVDLCPGDRLVLFSDGVPDAENRDGLQYGYDRLLAVVSQNSTRPAQELVDLIATEVTHWSQGAPPFDDLTLLVVEVR